MMKYRVPVALASALLFCSLFSGRSQAQAAAGKAASPTQTTSGAVKAPPSATSPAVLQAPKVPAPTDVVGTVNGKQVTWTDLLDRMRKDLPAQFINVAAQVAGAKVAAGLFGPDGKSQFTITQDEVLATIRQNPPPQLTNTLDNFLMQDAFKGEAEKQGVAVTDAQIQARITTQLKQLRTRGQIKPGETDEAWLNNFLTQQHLTHDQLLNNIRQSMLPYALLEKEIAKELGHPITATDYVQVRQIFIKAPAITPTSTLDDKKADVAALTKVQNIAALIKSGKKTFAQAAKEFNEDFATKKDAGVIPPYLRGGQNSEIEVEAFKLGPTDVSKPIRTQVGYYLIAIEKQGKDIPEEERQRILSTREGQMAQPYLASLRTKASVTNNIRPAGGMGGPMMSPGRPVGQPAAARQ